MINYKFEHENVFGELAARGYFEQVTYEDELRNLFGKEGVPFYTGFDATADSLTIGHFIQLMVMTRMQAHGRIPICFLGGRTTTIGDPSGRNNMRSIMTKGVIGENARRFYSQMTRFIDFGENKVYIENNKDWLLNLNFLDLMREIGVHSSVNQVLTLESYKNRMKQSLTFFEFSYMLMQSHDYLVLYRKYGCKLQMGGSDQWSNILGGYDLIRKSENDRVYAMTFKLLTTADGVKMDKSQKSAMWLDENKATPYDLFQYMRNVDDRDVEKSLLMLTLLPTDECKRLGSLEGSEISKAKEALAFEVCELVYGEEEAEEARQTTDALLNSNVIDENMPATEIKALGFENGIGLLNLLIMTSLTRSNSEARRLVTQNGISVNDNKETDPKRVITIHDFNDDELIIKKGKKVYHRIKLV